MQSCSFECDCFNYSLKDATYKFFDRAEALNLEEDSHVLMRWIL